LLKRFWRSGSTLRVDTAKPPADQFEQTPPQIKERKGQ
jgi:hypothetical protein